MPAIIAHPGMPLWIDLATTDIAAARKFYGELLGWEFQELDGENSGYVLARREGMPVAAMAKVPEGSLSMWGLCLYTPDVASSHDAAVSAGATSALQPRSLGERGAMAMLLDPAGAAIGLKCPADEHALLAAGEPATPVWYELLVGDKWEETLEFYHELAGWDIRQASNDADFRYAVGEIEGAGLAGMWDTSAMAEATSLWTIYMGVADINRAVEQIPELGGVVVRPPYESEFGRVATLQDPTGAILNLCEVAEYDPAVEDAHEPDLFAPEG